MYLMVGRAATMRAGLVISPVALSCGTLKSTRMTTRRPFNGTSVMDFFIRNSRGEFLGDLLQKIDAPAAIAPFVVVPADQFKEIAVQFDAAATIENART